MWTLCNFILTSNWTSHLKNTHLKFCFFYIFTECFVRVCKIFFHVFKSYNKSYTRRSFNKICKNRKSERKKYWHIFIVFSFLLQPTFQCLQTMVHVYIMLHKIPRIKFIPANFFWSVITISSALCLRNPVCLCQKRLISFSSISRIKKRKEVLIQFLTSLNNLRGMVLFQQY